MPDALVELEELVIDLPSAMGRQRLGQQLEISADKLRTGVAEAERLSALLALADLLKFESREQLEDIEEAREEAQRVGKDLIATEDDASQLREATDRFEKGFLPTIKRFHRNVILRWEVVSGRDFRPLVQIGEMLEKLDPSSSLGREMATFGTMATNYRPGASATDFLNQVNVLLSKRDELQRRRRAEYGDGAIAEFVNALAENRAKLDMVKPEVQLWLESHGASAWLKVST